MNSSIRKAYPGDAQAICDIYNPYVRDTVITFEQDPVTPPDMGGRIRAISADFPWLVSESERSVVGYAYASRWRSRAAYDQTVESTIYVRGGATGSGVGYPLYMALLEELRRRSLHVWVCCWPGSAEGRLKSAAR